MASGVTGFLSLGIQIVQSLVEFYSAYKIRAQDLAKISVKLESLLTILKCLDSALKNRAPETDDLLHELDKVAINCNEIIDELQAKCDKIQKDQVTNIKSQLYAIRSHASYPCRKKNPTSP